MGIITFETAKEIRDYINKSCTSGKIVDIDATMREAWFDIIKAQNNTNLTDDDIKKFIRRLAVVIDIFKFYMKNNSKDIQFYLLACVLDTSERNETRNVVYFLQKDLDSFLKFFKDATKAEEFLEIFYKNSQTQLKFQAVLELDRGMRGSKFSEEELSFIHALTDDAKAIADLENFKSLKRLPTYISLALNYTNSLKGTNQEKCNKVYEKLVESATLGVVDKIEIDKIKKAVKDKWAADIKNFFYRKTMSTERKIALCQEIATCLISTSNIIPYQTVSTLTSLGVSPESFSLFKSLVPKDSKELLPDLVVADNGYFICKLSYDDPIGPFLGLTTGCCQHLDGEGSTSAQFGYTESNSGFYVMFKGKPPTERPIKTQELKVKDIIAQSWCWRAPGSDALVFDSVEMENATDPIRLQNVKKMFFKLAKEIVEKEQSNPVLSTVPITRVMVGEGGMVQNLGIDTSYDMINTPKNPGGIDATKPASDVYTDAKKQMLLYDIRSAAYIKLCVMGDIDTDLINPATDTETLKKMLQYILDRQQNVDGKPNIFILKNDNATKQIDQLIILLESMTKEQRILLGEALSYTRGQDVLTYLLGSVGSGKVCLIKEYDYFKYFFENDKVKNMFLTSIENTLSKFISQMSDNDDEFYVRLLIRLYAEDVLHKVDPADFKRLFKVLTPRPSFLNGSPPYDLEVDYSLVATVLKAKPELFKDGFGLDQNGKAVTTLQCVVSKEIRRCKKSDKNSQLMEVGNLLSFILLHNSNGDKESLVCDAISAILNSDNYTQEMLMPLNTKSESPLIIAIEQGYTERVNTILSSSKFTPDLFLQSDKHGDNLLFCAIKHKQTDIAAELINSRYITEDLLLDAIVKINYSLEFHRDPEAKIKLLKAIDEQLKTLLEDSYANKPLHKF